MSHNPNTVKSQDDLSTTNDGKRSSEVLLSAIDKIADLEEWKKDMQAKYGNKSAELEKTKKQLEIAEHAINYAMMRCENCYGMVCQYCHLNYCITYYKDKERVDK